MSKATGKKEDFEADDVKHSSKLEAAVDREISTWVSLRCVPLAMRRCTSSLCQSRDAPEACCAGVNTYHSSGNFAAQLELGVFSERQLQMDTTRAGERDQGCEVLFRISKQSFNIAGGVHVGKDADAKFAWPRNVCWCVICLIHGCSLTRLPP